MKKKLFIFLLIIFFLQFIFRIFSYRNEYLSHFDSKYWKSRYEHSQWVVPNSKQSIGDDGLYAYAGWEYINGHDPTTLNAEIPPFGKYLIGLSIILFNNQNIFALLCGIFVLAMLFLLNKFIFKDNYLAFLPVFLFSFEPLFYTQLRAPFIDLLYLGLLLSTFYFFLREQFLISSIFLGLMTAAKASSTTFPLVSAAMLIYLIYMKHYPEIKKFFLYLPVAILVFLLTYIRYFLLGHDLRQFLGVQKWILTFYTNGAKGDPTSAWQILLAGKWPTWWGQTLAVNEWNIFWPLSLIATVYYTSSVLPKHKLYKSMLFAIWIFLYLIFLSFVPVWPRYLLLVLPFMYNLAIWVLSKKIRRS